MKFETFILNQDGALNLDGQYVPEEQFPSFFHEDGFDTLGFIKTGIRNWLETLSVDDVDKTNRETITLFHGTTTAHMNSILLSGIRPSLDTNVENWSKIESEDIRSAKNVTYLTNKFHYHYAFQINQMYRKEQGLDHEFWKDWKFLPCYFEIEVPKYLLVPDEDMVHSAYFKNKVKNAIKKGTPIEITWEESLAQYGTCGVLGGIKREYIKSVTILGDVRFYLKHYYLQQSQYAKEVQRWANGKGKGKLKNIEMIKQESESGMNGTLQMSQIPAGYVITDFHYNEQRDNLDFRIGK